MTLKGRGANERRRREGVVGDAVGVAAVVVDVVHVVGRDFAALNLRENYRLCCDGLKSEDRTELGAAERLKTEPSQH